MLVVVVRMGMVVMTMMVVVIIMVVMMPLTSIVGHVTPITS